MDRVIQCCVDAYYGVPFDTVPFAFWDPAGIDAATDETRYLVSVDLPDDHPDRIHGFSFLVDLLDLEIRKSATGRFYVYSERERA